MEHWKKNSSLRYFAGLALLMIPVIVMIIAAPAFARYKSDKSGFITFEVREPEQICFGKYDGTNFAAVTDSEEFVWILSEDRKTKTLELSVANGDSKSNPSKNDQKVSVRLVTGLGIAVEDGETEVTLTCDGRVYKARAEDIETGSTLFHDFGEGKILIFEDENGNEFYRILEGGDFHLFTVTISVDASAIAEDEKAVTAVPLVFSEITE